MEKLNNVKYDAFISYRHSDIDNFVCENLRKRLENFKLPRSVRSKIKNGKTKITRIFRDVDELPLADNLSDPISNALANSEFLITICTPRYLESRWCMKEIEEFLKTHDREHVLVVLAEGEPSESFPEQLMYVDEEVTDEKGNVTIRRKEIEPLAADTRGASKKEILKAMDTAVIKLCAAMFSLNFDDLKQRQREAKLKKMIAVFGGIGAAVLSFAIFATVMLIKISRQNVLIEQQYTELSDKYADQVAEDAVELLASGRKKDAVYALKSVLPDPDPGKAVHINANALKGMYEALNVYGVDNVYSPAGMYGVSQDMINFTVSYDCRYTMVYGFGEVRVYDTETEHLVNRISGEDLEHGAVVECAFCGSDGILVSYDELLMYYPLLTGSGKVITDKPYEQIWTKQSDDGEYAIAYTYNDLIAVDRSGNILYEISLKDLLTSEVVIKDATVSNGRILMRYSESPEEGDPIDHLDVLDAGTGEVLYDYKCTGGDIGGAALYGDTLFYAVSFVAGADQAGSSITATDISSEKKLWQAGDNSIVNVSNMRLVGDELIIDDSYDLFVLNAENGEFLNRIVTDERIINFWVSENGYEYICESGKVFSYQAGSLNNLTSTYFGEAALTNNLTGSSFVGNSLYCWFDGTTYVSRFAPQISSEAVKVTNKDEYFSMSGLDYAYEYLTGSDYARMDQVSDAYFSADHKYVIVWTTDNSIDILDASDFKVMASLSLNNAFTDMSYSETTGSYIISTYDHSFILDDDFNIISKTRRIAAGEDGCFIILNSDYDAYKLPFVDYNGLMKKASDYLEGYEPGSDIRVKYGQ